MRENCGRVKCEARTCSKSAGRSGTKHISKSRVQKTEGYGALLDVHMSFRVAGARDSASCQKRAKCVVFLNSILKKNNGRRGTLELQAQYERDVRRSERWFPEKKLQFGVFDLEVCRDAFASQVQHFVWPSRTFSWQPQSFRHMDWKDQTPHWHEAIGSALIFHFWRKSRRIVPFWCCQPRRKLRGSRRIASFITLSSQFNIEDVSQKCCFNAVKLKKWGCIAEKLGFQTCR